MNQQQNQHLLKTMQTLFSQPPFCIVWQAGLPTIFVWCITFFVATDPFYRGFNLFFYPLLTYIIALNLLCIVNTFSAKGGMQYQSHISFGTPPKPDARSPLGDTPIAQQQPHFYYESHETMSFGHHE